MKKGYLISIAVIIFLVGFYGYAIDAKKAELNASDRSLLIMNYQGQNYYGVFNVTQSRIRLMTLDNNLNLSSGKKVSEYTEITEFVEAIENEFTVEINDYFQFNDDKLAKSNLTIESELYYEELLKSHDEVTQLLAGEIKYHPQYNVPLVRIVKNIYPGDSGEINRKKVKKLQDENLSEKEINQGFYDVKIPELTCDEQDICSFPDYSIKPIVSAMNSGTKYKINVKNLIKE